MAEHNCRVCGLYIENPPWGDDGNCPTYEYCPCCNVEFGNQDYTNESAKQFRDRWIGRGAPWFEIDERPKEWSLEEQLKNIPEF